VTRAHWLVVVALLAAAPAVAQTPVWTDVVPFLEATILPIAIGDGQDAGSCTGIVIHAEAGYVLTAAHCVPTDSNKTSMTVTDRDAAIVRVNRHLDLAVLKVRLRKGAITIAFAPIMPRAGSAVAVLGYPFGARSLTVQHGIVANPDVEGWAWINADTLPGDSGGAIVDREGRLVALTSGYLYRGAAHIGRAVPLETIRAFVEEYVP
jgi:S1-C subfamily serine protease